MKIFEILLLVLVSVISMETYGGCSNTIATQDFNINFGDIVAPKGASPGTVIATSTGNYNLRYTCTDNNYQYREVMYNTSLGNNLYDVGIKGYGVRISENDTGGGFHHYFGPFGDRVTGSFTATYLYKVELVRTNDVAISGLLRIGKIADVIIKSQIIIGNWYITGGSISTLICKLNSNTLNFPLGNITATSFGSSVGITPTNARVTQNLGLTCDPGANINITLSGQQNPDLANKSVLALSGQGQAGVAKGVGVQILYGGVPLNINESVFLKQSTGGLESLPIVARYYQTKTTVFPGTANATATLNITYQ